MTNNHINYIEFKTNDLDETKEFYTMAFNWSFTDYGQNYIAFSESGLDGGFEKCADEITNGALIVLYHEDLNKIKDQVIQAKGRITKDIFTFPGGHRFHFLDPSGNELAIWSDK
ncbi:putative enzyme related to lactoylglutathione lyase [Pedobacter sp. CAN_A7]|uniref:VOC family protein n=1 Tax=Pedobacter sp. CAN_A7 TaxID=2787722 RepID=UPI0018C99926